jgi:Outer membrane protein beta-barrel domain
MKLKQSLLLIFTTIAILSSTSGYAAREGINFYYGLGLGALSLKDIDTTVTGDVMIGFEEDGWAFEAIAYGSLEAGSADPTVDYSASGNHLGIAYRTIERNGQWFKFKISSTDMNFDFNDTLSSEYKTSGTSYALGWGIRMARDARLELEYSYYNTSDLDDPVHWLGFKYFWGGS